MPNRTFFKANSFKGLAAMLLFLFAGSFASYFLYGPYYSPDTVNYFNFSQVIFEKNIWTGIYSPAYPFLLWCLTRLFPLTLFRASHLLILVQYGLGIYFLFRWTKIHAAHYRFNRGKAAGLLLSMLIIFHSWWSFRIISWAHADAVFYCLLILWAYSLSQYFTENNHRQLLLLSLVSSAMIWVKLNALALLPFYVLLIITDTHRKRWLAPLGVTTVAYAGYRYLSQYRLLDSGTSGGDIGFSLFSGESLGLLANNLAESFRSTLGFFLSDLLTAYVPQIVAIVGGGLLLLFLAFLAFKEIKAGINLSSLFLLFGLVYLLCQLAFQQLIGFEEINYRTLFPYFLTCSGYGLFKLSQQKKLPVKTIILAALLISGHTLAGHAWLWQRGEVNSLFEVERLAETEMVDKLRLLHQDDLTDNSFISNRPELLGLLLDAPFVVHYDPEFDFIHGKRRPVPDLQRQQRRVDLMERLLKAEAVVVVFGEDEDLIRLAKENGLVVAEFPEGVVVRGLSGREKETEGRGESSGDASNTVINFKPFS